ncbi:MAG: phosphatidylserine/phosphatidylglycerophosphate/cardiolipin synthase family protein [bacterium]
MASGPVGAWAALSAEERQARIAAAWVAPPDPGDADGVMRALTDGWCSSARRVVVELDNGAARRRLLGLIGGARARVWLQTYIFEADAVGHAVVDALLAAAARGVAVRVLVDALYSLHGAMGQRNPALARLTGAGVELLVIRPFGVPGLDDLKRRDHRKFLVVDDAVGWVTGRNVGAPYYTGFDEVRLSPESSYREVPWLDAGAEVEGPVVAGLSRAFARHWAAAGGGALGAPVVEEGAGAIKTWLVLHESMGDTRTLDAFRRLIETARERLVVVNTFPLQFELQRALQAALARGVRVRYLVGHVRPLFGEAGTPFRGGAIRSLATEVIHGRLDALIAAGAEARGFALRAVPGWDPALGTVRPHVHAKLLSVDGRVFAVGSANLDISAGYWESEALLIVEDAGETARVDAALDRLLDAGVPIAEGPRWAETAVLRTTISRHWPSLLG